MPYVTACLDGPSVPLIVVSENVHNSWTTWLYLDQIAYIFILKCLATGMQNGDGAAGRI